MYNQYEYFSRVKEVSSWTISSRSSTISLSISRKKDACPERTARWEPFFHGAPLDLVDAKDGLVYNASLTGFQEGFRLGLRLGLALPPPEDLQL